MASPFESTPTQQQIEAVDNKVAAIKSARLEKEIKDFGRNEEQNKNPLSIFSEMLVHAKENLQKYKEEMENNAYTIGKNTRKAIEKHWAKAAFSAATLTIGTAAIAQSMLGGGAATLQARAMERQSNIPAISAPAPEQISSLAPQTATIIKAAVAIEKPAAAEVAKYKSIKNIIGALKVEPVIKGVNLTEGNAGVESLEITGIDLKASIVDLTTLRDPSRINNVESRQKVEAQKQIIEDIRINVLDKKEINTGKDIKSLTEIPGVLEMLQKGDGGTFIIDMVPTQANSAIMSLKNQEDKGAQVASVSREEIKGGMSIMINVSPEALDYQLAQLSGFEIRGNGSISWVDISTKNPNSNNPGYQAIMKKWSIDNGRPDALTNTIMWTQLRPEK